MDKKIVEAFKMLESVEEYPFRSCKKCGGTGVYTVSLSGKTLHGCIKCKEVGEKPLAYTCG